MYTLFITHPCIHLHIHPILNGPILPMIEFLLTQLLSHHFHCYFCSTVLLISDIFKPSPWGENRSPPQSGTNCFVRFTNPEPNPDKRTLVRTAVLFCLRPSCRLWHYQSMHCAAVLHLWLWWAGGGS